MTGSVRLKKLLEPLEIKGMKLRNRFVMAPMLGGSDLEGYATEQMAKWYENAAQGGVGMIILGAHCIDASNGRLMPIQGVIDDDKYIPGISRVAESIQKHGAKAVMQIFHGGPAVRTNMIQTEPKVPVAASVVKRHDGDTPRELPREDFSKIVSLHVDAALRAKRAGFDAVEIHAANRYLINSFLSRAWNTREDEYGGSVENRARFFVEIIEAVRKALGDDFPLFARINGAEYGEINGLEPEEARQIARIGQEAGIDVIDVSAVNPTTSASPSYYWGDACFFHLAENIKKVVDVPVIIAGRITAELGEKALLEGQADLIAMARQMLADPELPNKVAEGNLEDILPCQSCNSCRGGTRDYPGAVCAVNPIAQRNWEFSWEKTTEPKKVLVVGGGPAGMEFAKDAAALGHTVRLFEKRDRLGGQLLAASLPPNKEKITSLIHYLERQVEKAGVTVELNTEATADLIEKENPDAVVIATGAVPIIPQIPGVDQDLVMNALDVLWKDKEPGKNVVVVGGGLIGCETAEFLAEEGKNVTIIEMLDAIGMDIGPNRLDVLEWLNKGGVKMLAGTKLEEITKGGVNVSVNGESRFIEADSVVISVGLKSDKTVAESLEGKVEKIYTIGDCVSPRRILEAIHDGFNAAINL